MVQTAPMLRIISFAILVGCGPGNDHSFSCTPRTLRCAGNVIWICTSQGNDESLYTYCSNHQVCRDSSVTGCNVEGTESAVNLVYCCP